METYIKAKKLTTIILITIGVLIIGSAIFMVFSKNDTYNYSISKPKYEMKISYRRTPSNELDTKVKDLVELTKQEFLKKAEKLEENTTIKYNLVIDEDIKEYQNNIYAHVLIKSFTGGNDYERKDITYAYDNNKKEFITVKNILKDEELNNLSIVVKRLFNIYEKNNKVEYNQKKLNEESYNNFYIDENGLTIIFVPNHISKEETRITIPWGRLNTLLKKEYQKQTSVQKRDISKYKNKKVIAFTFDDGPNTETTKILLDNLDKYDAKVTFFVVGNRVNDNKEILKRAYQEGNDIGSHTYSHKELTEIKDKEVEKEISKANEKIKQAIGIEPIYLRPPYGSINDKIRNNTIMNTICWNVDSLDWKTKNRKKIRKEIVKHAGDGDIVLLHDIYKESVYGALLAMNDLKKKGYSFVTITEMAELKNIELKFDKTYYGF